MFTDLQKYLLFLNNGPKVEDSWTGSKSHKTSYEAEVLHFHHSERETGRSKTTCSQPNSVLALQPMLIAEIRVLNGIGRRVEAQKTTLTTLQSPIVLRR